MYKLTDWIKRHQISAFFIITFVITWGLGFSYSAVLKRNQFLFFPLVFVATCGPGLTGIFITAITNSQPKYGQRKRFWIAFFVAWLMSALVSLANMIFIQHIPLSPTVIALFIITIVPVAFVIASAFSRIPATKNYLSSLIQLRGVLGWSLLGLVLAPSLFLISNLTSRLVAKQPIPSTQLPEISLTMIGLVLITFLYQFFFFNATGEETGWRGFAMPRLQAHTSPLVAAMIIALFWVPWHFFLWQAEGSPVLTWQFWIEKYVIHICASVLLVWICNRAHGSILVAGITHAAMNTAAAFIPIGDGRFIYITFFIAVLIMILVDRMWKKLPPDHLAVIANR